MPHKNECEKMKPNSNSNQNNKEDISKRIFKTSFDPVFLKNMQLGVMRYQYKGIDCLKCPLDMALYAKLIWDLKPKTLIEIGTYKGGSALWFADMLDSYGLTAAIISIDHFDLNQVRDERIQFIQGDVHHLEKTITPKQVADLAHPILVIEDSAHTYEGSLAAMKFFDTMLSAGDVMIIEDGVLDELGLGDQFSGGPNRAVATFIDSVPHRYRIMTEYCDFYGLNATYNPNGYLKRI